MRALRLLPVAGAFLGLLGVGGYEDARADTTSPAAQASTDTVGPLAMLHMQGEAAGRRDDLRPSSDPPWNPSRPVPRRRAWEEVLLFPGRVATLPLSGLGRLTERTFYYAEQTALAARLGSAARQIRASTGLSIGPARLGERTGLGGSVRMGTGFLENRWSNVAQIQYSASTKDYNSTRIQLMGRPMFFQYGYDWRPRDRFYGVGLETSRDSVSDYATQSEFVRANVGWGWNRDDEDSDPRTEVLLWFGPRALVTRTGREPGTPSFHQRFPAVANALLDRRQEHLVYGLRFENDWRLGRPHWGSGWRVAFAAERFDKPIDWLALRDGQGRGAQFTRYDVMTETGYSFFRDARTVRLMVRLLDHHISGGRERFLIEDMARLGGREGLHGFEAGRWHDLDLIHLRANYIFPLQRHAEMDLHAEAGHVYADVWNDASLRSLEHSLGFAFRIRTDRSPVAAIGLDFSREQTRLRFSFGGVE
jgi:hypothetical protein